MYYDACTYIVQSLQSKTLVNYIRYLILIIIIIIKVFWNVYGRELNIICNLTIGTWYK